MFITFLVSMYVLFLSSFSLTFEFTYPVIRIAHEVIHADNHHFCMFAIECIIQFVFAIVCTIFVINLLHVPEKRVE